MSFPNDVKSIIFFGKSNLELYFSAIPYSFTPDSLQGPYSLSPDWVLIGHYIFKKRVIFFAPKNVEGFIDVRALLAHDKLAKMVEDMDMIHYGT